jgi:hypothetical protein
LMLKRGVMSVCVVMCYLSQADAQKRVPTTIVLANSQKPRANSP